MKMKACLLDGFHQDFHWEDDIEIAEPRANEIRVKIVSCGLCHTERAEQVNLWGLGLPFPIVLGHEGAGVVESVGPGVTKFKVGDKVAMSTPWCGDCPACASGQPWACEHTDELEIRGVDYYGTPGPLSRNGKPVYTFFNQSALAEYSTIHINNCTKLPDDFDLRIAGPLGCGFRTGAGAVYNVCKPKLNEWVIITGTGAVGFAAMWVAKAMGARTVMVDIVQHRLDTALELGADAVLNSKGMSADEMGEKLLEITGGGAENMAECTGAGICYKGGLKALKWGGRCASVAFINKMEYEYFTTECHDCKNVQFIRMGNVAGDTIIPIMAQLYKRGMFPYDKLIKFYHFTELEQAMEDAHTGAAIKPVLLWDLEGVEHEEG